MGQGRHQWRPLARQQLLRLGGSADQLADDGRRHRPTPIPRASSRSTTAPGGAGDPLRRHHGRDEQHDRLRRVAHRRRQHEQALDPGRDQPRQRPPGRQHLVGHADPDARRGGASSSSGSSSAQGRRAGTLGTAKNKSNIGDNWNDGMFGIGIGNTLLPPNPQYPNCTSAGYDGARRLHRRCIGMSSFHPGGGQRGIRGRLGPTS